MSCTGFRKINHGVGIHFFFVEKKRRRILVKGCHQGYITDMLYTVHSNLMSCSLNKERSNGRLVEPAAHLWMDGPQDCFDML